METLFGAIAFGLFLAAQLLAVMALHAERTGAPSGQSPSAPNHLWLAYLRGE